MFSRKLFVRLFLSVIFSFTPFISHSATSQILFRIHGSNTLGAELSAQLLMAWFNERGASHIQRIPTQENEYRIRAYQETLNTWQEVEVTAHGSSTGIKHLIEKTGDIAAASRSIKSTEKTALGLNKETLAEFEQVVAIDGLAIIVHPNNPIKKLSLAQLKAIFSGEIKTWEELNAGTGAIHLYARDERSGTWDSFSSLVLQNAALAPAKRFESNNALAAEVSADPNGIGFTSLSAQGKSKVLAIYEGDALPLLPTSLSIATEDYLLSRRLFMYSTSPKPAVRDFLQFIQSQAGQNIVEKVGFISQNIRAVSPAAAASLPAEFNGLSTQAQRLTVNFRFIEGKIELDNKGNKDLQRLADYMRTRENYRLVLLGFTDPKSSDENSKLLSRLRTKMVNSKLMRLGVHHAEAIGLGDGILVAETQTLIGQIKNRRVEVWIQPI